MFSLDTKKSSQLLIVGKADLQLLISLFTGHCTLREHSSVLKVSDKPSCPKCGEEDGTPEHLFTNSK